MSDRETTRSLMERLRRHYIKPGPMPGGTFIPECGINGGAQTRADALYVGFTSTSGRILIGHEVKVSRADWRKELDSAGKADFWADNCHAWYIVAPSTDVVPKEEVPHGWGLMVPNPRTKTRMDVLIKAPVHADRQPSWKATRSIMARLDTLRAQHDAGVRQSAMEDARAESARLREVEDARQGRRELSYEHERRLTTLDRLEKLLGCSIQDWWDGADERVSPEVAAGALRMMRATAALESRDLYAVDALRRSGQKLLDGLAEYEAAQAALANLMRSEVRHGG